MENNHILSQSSHVSAMAYEKKSLSFTGLSLSTCMLLLCLICEFGNELLVHVANLFSHFYVGFTENVKIDLTGAIQMFTNTGT